MAGHCEYQVFELRVDPRIQDAIPIITSIETSRKKLTVEKSQIENELAKDSTFKSRLNQIDFILRNSLEYPIDF